MLRKIASAVVWIARDVTYGMYAASAVLTLVCFFLSILFWARDGSTDRVQSIWNASRAFGGFVVGFTLVEVAFRIAERVRNGK